MFAYSSNQAQRRPGTYLRMFVGLVTAAISLQAYALPLLSSESYNPVLWGPAAVSSQFVQYSLQVSSSGSSVDQQFLNVVRNDGTWVVQNLPVGFEPGTSAIATNIDSTLFANGSTYQTTLSATPGNVAPVFSTGVVQILGSSVNRLFNDDFGITDFGPFTSPGLPSNSALNFGPVLSYSYHAGMPDLEQGDNECMPTSAANSLTWLNETHNLGLTMTTEQIRDILKDKNHMKTSARKGTLISNFLVGKDKFVNENNLRIVTHRIGDFNRPTFADILAEMKKGQDVELGFRYTDPFDDKRYGHMVTLVGLIDLGPFGRGIWYNDPADGQTQTNWSWVDGIEGSASFSIRGEGDRNRVELAIAESVPEPGSLALVFLGMLALMRFHAPRATQVA